MIPAGTRIWMVAGITDLRRGFVGLSAMVQTALEQNPFSGHVFVFRGDPGYCSQAEDCAPAVCLGCHSDDIEKHV